MIVQRFFERRLAQASYLIGCEQSREAIVIDPNRDIEPYIRTAGDFGVRISHVTETHIHADYLSGSRVLAERAGARLHLSGLGPEGQGYELTSTPIPEWLEDGSVIEFGTVRLTAVHSPGHTPEHISFLVTDLANGEHPFAAITGDFVFVGDVGRPDLLERTALLKGSFEESARALHRSIEGFLELPDYVQVWPGHGAGSACGKQLSAVPTSTVGYERMYNPALRPQSEPGFIAAIGEGQPDVPPYFAEMKRRNRLGGATSPLPELQLLQMKELEELQEEDTLLVDIRRPDLFAAGHLPGSLNIPLAKPFTTWTGSVVPYDRDIVLIGTEQSAVEEAARELSLIGLDRGIGGMVVAESNWQQLSASGEALATSRRIGTAELDRLLRNGDTRVVDVRATSEWEEGHIVGAQHAALGSLREAAPSLPHQQPVVVHCESGYRSSIAASLLKKMGIENVLDYHEGFPRWVEAGGRVER